MGANKIDICHWNGSAWNAIEVNHNALNGHDNHALDVWPPVEGVTPGQNWPTGETIYLNGCVLSTEATPSPSASSTAEPSPSTTLPPTGAGENLAMSVLGVALLLSGAWMKMRSTR